MARPSWISRLFSTPRPAGPPIVSVDMIPERRAFFDWSELNRDLPPMKEAHEHVSLGSLNDRGLEAEVYVPHGPGPFGALLYLHGGAFCTLSPAHVRKLAMRLTGNAFIVVNLDYSLAPEHRFPRAVEDFDLRRSLDHAARPPVWLGFKALADWWGLHRGPTWPRRRPRS